MNERDRTPEVAEPVPPAPRVLAVFSRDEGGQLRQRTSAVRVDRGTAVALLPVGPHGVVVVVGEATCDELRQISTVFSETGGRSHGP